MRDRRTGERAAFFLDAVREEKREYDRRQEEIPILSDPRLKSEKARLREAVEKAKRAEAQRLGIEFDVLAECGYRYSTHVLPEELQDCHLAWAFSGENMKDYFYIIRHYTMLEVQEAMAMRRATEWIREEND